MPSLLRPPPPLLNHHHLHHRHHHHIPLLPSLLSSFILFFFLLLFLLFLYKKLSASHSSSAAAFPLHHHPHLRRFSFSHLRRATSNFSPSSFLGHGGFGSVHKATATTLPAHPSLAVKLMHSPSSPQSSLEFHNELSLSSSLHSPHILSLLGFSASRGGQKLALVYELMANKSLQDALLDRKCEELMEWSRRFEIACDVARGLEYLHHVCDPPVIHGDIKPSNILLDEKFSAKIGDFGLARVKSSEDPAVDNWSILEETEGGLNQSPESCVIRILDSEPSPEMKESVAEIFFDRISVESAKDSIPSGGGGRKKGGSGRDWWWKQDNVGGSESGRVKDYVMDWIGSEINKEKPNSEFVDSSISVLNNAKIEEKKKHWKKEKKKKNRKPREWWKEEFCEELTKKTKKKKKRGLSSGNGGDMWWQGDKEESKKKKRKPSRSSIDGWLDNFNYEFNKSGDIPKSGGISSTPSMRGTMCYIAPEYGGGGGGGAQLSEKCDVYSFGVLLLVLVSGRRPLQVTTASPMSELERANLVSWARQLAYNGKLLELVDPAIHSLDNEQALLCITIALLCLQRSPGKRPSMKEIVGMLLGEAEPPALPFEFSPSPTFPFKSGN